MVWEQIKKKLKMQKLEKKLTITGIVQNGRMLVFSGMVSISSDKKSIIVQPKAAYDNYFINIEELKNILKGRKKGTGMVSWIKIDDEIDEISGVV